MKENITIGAMTVIILALILCHFLTIKYFLGGIWSGNLAMEKALNAVAIVEEATQKKR